MRVQAQEIVQPEAVADDVEESCLDEFAENVFGGGRIPAEQMRGAGRAGVRAGHDGQASEQQGGIRSESPVGEVEGRGDPAVPGHQDVEPALVHGEPVGQAAHAPAGTRREPATGDPQSQGQVAAPQGHLTEGSGFPAGALLPDHPAEEGEGFLGGQHSQTHAVHVLKAGEHLAAGHHAHAPAPSGQQRRDLGLVAGIVEHQQAAPVAEEALVERGPPGGTSLGDLRVRDVELLEHAQHDVRRRGRILVHAPQVHHHLAVREVFRQYPGRLQGQRGLAHAGRSRYGHDRGPGTTGRGSGNRGEARRRVRQCGQLVPPSDEIVDAAGERTHRHGSR